MSEMLSIIIPVHNDRDRLLESLESLTDDHTLRPQIIVVDDASDDDSLQVAERFLEGYAGDGNVLRLAENQGAGGARNEGMKQATGKYLLFFDADDYAYPGMTSRLCQAAEIRDAELVLTRYHRVLADANMEMGLNSQDDAIFKRLLKDVRGGCSSIKDIPYALELVNYPWNKLIRRDYAEGLPLVFSRTPVHNDVFAHWTLMMNARRISVLDEPFCGHRVSENAERITNISDVRRMAMIKVFEEVESYFIDFPGLKRRYYPFFVSFKIRLYKWARDRIDTEHLDDFRERFLNTFADISSAQLFNIHNQMPNVALEATKLRLRLL